ncbi:MAG: calcium-binding protein [Rubrivivax sp.]
MTLDEIDSIDGGLAPTTSTSMRSAWGDVGFGSIFWGGKRADGSTVAAVDFNASFDAVNTFLGAASTTVIYATYAQRNIFGQPTGLEASGAVTLSFSGVEFIDSFLASRAVAGNDLVIARNPGTFDGGLGNDKLYADLSAFTGDVSLDASSDQPYSYAGYDFKDFEAFLVSTGPGNDSVDTSAFAIADYFKLGAGHNTARTGGGNDVILTSGNGVATIDSGAGNDTVVSGLGNDHISTGDGTDDVTSNDGNDTVELGKGSDKLDAGSGNDTISVTLDEVDSIDGGLGTDHLNVDASAWGDVGFGSIFWGGKRADGSTVAAVDFNASFDAVNTFLGAASTTVIYATYAQRNIFGQPTGLEASGAVTLSFSGVEFIDSFLASRAVAGNDLVIARNPGTFDGGLGNDEPAPTSPPSPATCRWTSSDQPTTTPATTSRTSRPSSSPPAPATIRWTPARLPSPTTSSSAQATTPHLHRRRRRTSSSPRQRRRHHRLRRRQRPRSSAAWATTTSPPATAPTTSPATTATTRSSWARAATSSMPTAAMTPSR